MIPADMDSNSKNGKQVPAGKKHVQRMLLFPALVVAIYGALFTFTPDRSKPALHNFNNDQGDII